MYYVCIYSIHISLYIYYILQLSCEYDANIQVNSCDSCICSAAFSSMYRYFHIFITVNLSLVLAVPICCLLPSCMKT